jgi:L-fucose mutarotase/ribose pyranase (RbsD/FucU family)
MTHPKPGIGVDAAGSPPVDPTENVKALMEASLKAVAREAMLQEKLLDEKVKRMELESAHQGQIAALRANHSKEIQHMESERVDRIRAVDVQNAAATAAQLLSAVNNLAATATVTAETLRNQVASTAQAAIASQAALINPIIERVLVLEKSSYMGAGKAGVTDPAIERMSSLVETLVAGQATGAGQTKGVSLATALAISAFGIIATLCSLGLAVYAALKP